MGGQRNAPALITPWNYPAPINKEVGGTQGRFNSHYKAFLSIYFMGQAMELFHNKIFKFYIICIVFCLDTAVLWLISWLILRPQKIGTVSFGSVCVCVCMGVGEGV